MGAGEWRTERSCDLEAKGQRAVGLGDREAERKTWNPSDQHALSPASSPQSSRGRPDSRYRAGCSQALPPSARSTVEVEFVQNKVFRLNISAPQCRTHRERVGEDGRPAVWGAPADRPTATGPGRRSPPTLKPRVRGGPGWASPRIPTAWSPTEKLPPGMWAMHKPGQRGGRGHRGGPGGGDTEEGLGKGTPEGSSVCVCMCVCVLRGS